MPITCRTPEGVRAVTRQWARKNVLVRADGAGGTHELLHWLTSQRVQYSVGFSPPDSFTNQIIFLDKVEQWQPAYDGDGDIRVSAFVARPPRPLLAAAAMRVIIRK